MNFSRVENKKSLRRPIGIDLFAGAGGLSLGFEQAGFDIAAAVEIDPIHCAVHEFNFPHCAALCADASKIGAEDIRRAAKLKSAPVDVVFGGAPCQGFSLIGKRALDDPRNRLLLEFVRLTVELDAGYFVFENVKGLTIGRHRQLLDELIEAFHSNGYDVLSPYSVLNAADFGVPQDRRRLFLIGAKKGLSLPQYPLNTAALRTTVWEAIGDLPDADEYSDLIESDSTSKARFGRASRYARVLREFCAGWQWMPEIFPIRGNGTRSASLRACARSTLHCRNGDSRPRNWEKWKRSAGFTSSTRTGFAIRFAPERVATMGHSHLRAPFIPTHCAASPFVKRHGFIPTRTGFGCM